MVTHPPTVYNGTFMSTILWSTAEFLTPSASASWRPPYALIILNQPIDEHIHTFAHLWDNAALKICADGGGNRLFDAFAETEASKRYTPDYIRGDLDSLRLDVRNFYESLGTVIQRDEDQEDTDFMKCIDLVRTKEAELSTKYAVIALGAIGGRFDQTMSSIHYLHLLKNERIVILLSDESMTFLLDKGKHEIRCDRRVEGPTCGIMPIGVMGARITTQGLKWNLTDAYSSFGGLISTSNHLDADVVTVETDQPVIWTVEVSRAVGG